MRSAEPRDAAVHGGSSMPAPEGERPPGAEAPQGGRVAVSVVVPVAERPEPLAPLYEEYASALAAAGESFEFLFMIPAWARPLVAPLEELAREGEPIRILEVAQQPSEASLLKLAADRCRGEILLTLPAYHRVSPEGLWELIRGVREGADLVSARRWPRRDPWINRLQTRIFHFIITRLAGKGRSLRDIGCGVRAMRPELLREVPVYGDFSRFLPLLAEHEGWSVEERACPQHPLDRQTRVYGPATYVRRVIDLLGVLFLVRFTYKPLRFFGLIGSVFSLAGGIILVVLFLQRMAGQALADRPMLLLGMLLLTFGVQAIALGLVGEMIVHLHAPERRGYRLRGSVEVSGEPDGAAGEPDETAGEPDGAAAEPDGEAGGRPDRDVPGGARKSGGQSGGEAGGQERDSRTRAARL